MTGAQTTIPAAPAASRRRPGGRARPEPALSLARWAGRAWPPLVLLLGLSACTGPAGAPTATANPTATAPPGGSPSAAAPQATASPDEAGPDPAALAQASAVAAYRGMWAAYDAAATTADPDSPELAQSATGTALYTLRQALSDMADAGRVGRGSVVVNPVVVAADPPSAPTTIGVSDCADTSGAVLYQRDGGPVNTTPGGWRHVDATVVLTDTGVWKVSFFVVQAVGSCGH